MKTSTKLIIAGTAVGVIVAGALVTRHFIKVDKENHSVQIIGGADGPTSVFLAGKIPEDRKQAEYTSISMEEAKEVFAAPGTYIILDVRRADEFAEGHIPGAINVANEDIGTDQPAELPDLDQVIFVYCRSGRRSKEASAKLAAIGYTNIYEFGGILDWDGEIEK
jgi:rhodanese-related sulfurtransferase